MINSFQLMRSDRLSLAHRRRKVNELTIFAPLREKFHAEIFLLLRVFKINLQWCSPRSLLITIDRWPKRTAPMIDRTKRL